MGRLFYALFLQRRVNDGCPEEKDQCTTARVFVTTKSEPVDRYICVTSRNHSGSGIVRMVQSVWFKSLRQTEIQKFRVNIFVFLNSFIVLNNNHYLYSQYAFGVVGDVGTTLRCSRQF